MSTPWPPGLVDRLVAFLPALTEPPFHVEVNGYRCFADRLAGFPQAIQDAGMLLSFDWGTWARGEGAAVVAGEGVDRADVDTVRRALTAHLRCDRFSEGHLLRMVERGDVAALIRRLDALRTETAWSWRVGTWNVERVPAGRVNGQRQHLDALDADIWVLTETRDRLDLGAPFQAVASGERRGGERWVTLWSRLPLLERLPVRDPDRTVAARFAGPAGPIVVYGTVLPWHADRGPLGTARNWTEHHRVIPEQAQEWAALAAEHPDATLCVAGDYNSDLATPHVYGTRQGRELLEAGLAAAGLRCATRCPPGLAAAPIDHISLSGTVAARVVSAWEGTVDGARLSDHPGMIVEVSGSETPKE